MPFDPLPTSLPDLSRSRPKSFRRGTAIDHIVSFPSPPPIGGASTERRDPASLFASSTSQRPASVSGHGGLRVWQAARSGSCLHYHTNGRSIQDLRSYLPTRDQLHAHTHTHARARFLGRVHAIAHPFASINVHARPRSSTLSTLSTIESLSRVLVLRSNLLPLPRARWNQRWKECSADRNGRNAERLVLDAGN